MTVDRRHQGRVASRVGRRSVLFGAGGLGVLAAGGIGILKATGGPSSGDAVDAGSAAVRRAEAERRPAGQRTVTADLRVQSATVSLGGLVVPTWAYGDSVPGPLIRATAGDLLKVNVDNALGSETSVHWHGIALRNDMDGVPGITQRPIAAGSRFTYEFTVPDPGTYFYHPHTGVQLDRGLYGVLVVDDPAEPGAYDQEWVVVLDDWVDGTGTTPDAILEELLATTGSSSGMDGMEWMDGMEGMHGMPGMGEAMQSPLLGGAGDVTYPHYLVNGRTPGAPATLTGEPGQRVRIRIINAGSDTAFRLAIGGHRLTVTHSDGFPVQEQATDALLIGMGERYDVVVTLADGAFPLVASAEGKAGQGLAVVRAGSGRAPRGDVRVAELDGQVLLGTDLVAPEASRLPSREVDRSIDLVLGGTMAPYRWTINGEVFPDARPLEVVEGERIRLRFENRTMMFHPMHLHGHTYGQVRGGARKDTTIVRPMQTVEVDFDATNPGQWAAHCHNIYHAESGMMTTVSYRT